MRIEFVKKGMLIMDKVVAVVEDDVILVDEKTRLISNIYAAKYNSASCLLSYAGISEQLDDERMLTLVKEMAQYRAQTARDELEPKQLELFRMSVQGIGKSDAYFCDRIKIPPFCHDEARAALDHIRQHSSILQFEEMLREYESGHNVKRHDELRLRCNVCGHIFCYTIDDFRQNRRNATLNAIGGVAQIGSGLTGNVGGAIYGKQLSSNKLIDFSRCPSCGSSDIAEYDSDANPPIFPAVQPAASFQSDADEILKFKKLQEQGIITEEEFEAKKRQLLGL